VNPLLHQHRYWLTYAEQQRWMGNHAAAEAAYERAIEGAEQHGFVQVSRSSQPDTLGA
jgi:hypothetical protein